MRPEFAELFSHADNTQVFSFLVFLVLQQTRRAVASQTWDYRWQQAPRRGNVSVKVKT